MKKIAIIGGTGVGTDEFFRDKKEITVITPYGDVKVIKALYNENTIYFVERHGKGHCLPPHKVNYAANIYALKLLNVDRIFATAAVGSIYKDIEPGTFVIIDQFLDFTKNRISTFFNGENGVVHIDMTEPYCIEARKTLIDCCKNLNIKHLVKGTYVCTEGPRFENKAEINMYKILGGQVVGMTNYPEVVLAREAGLCYAAAAMVTNYCTGISDEPLTQKEVADNMKLMSLNLRKLILSAIDNIPEIKSCSCRNAAAELGSLK
jgi:5'-methylthioadenosine phosphorylase